MTRALLMAGLSPTPLVRFVNGGGTFTRASEGSYYLEPPNTAGGFLAWAGVNTIREDRRDGVTGGYLFEPSRTNLCFQSEDLSTGWTLANCSITGSTAIAPDGAADCRTLSYAAGAGSISRTVAGTANGIVYSTTVWVRKVSGTANAMRLRVVDRNALSTYTADQPVSSTWTRLEQTITWGTGVSTPAVYLANDAGNNDIVVEVWGFQVEAPGQIPAPSSYIRTTTAAVARSVDSLTFASVPDIMRFGRWTHRASPAFTQAETGGGNPVCFAFTTADEWTGFSSATYVAFAATVAKYSKTALTYPRYQLMTCTVDQTAMQATVTGAATGSGTGAVGAYPSWGTGYMRVGGTSSGGRLYMGRIWEPYAATVQPLLAFASGAFTRASEASYYTRAPDAVGGFLSWATNNSLREDKRDNQPGLYLFEGARTNICWWSEDLTNALWVLNGGTTITGTTATAPDGGADACTVTFTALNTDSLSQLIQPATTNNIIYMASVWVRKTVGTGNVRLRWTDRAGALVTSADLSISTTWKLIELACPGGVAGPAATKIELLNDAAGTAQSIETWGFQVEARGNISVGTSYMRTLGAASATRPADVLTYASGVPAAMRSGKWLWRESPGNSSGDGGAGAGNFNWKFHASQLDFVTGAGNPKTRVNNVDQFVKAGGSFSRNQILTQQLDMAAAVYTIQGWTTANGAGAAGTPVSFGDYLQIACSDVGRISEPYAWT